MAKMDSGEYNAYRNARTLCENPAAKGYEEVGGRGIKFSYNTFQEFIQDVGWMPTPRLKLTRIDEDGHFEKGNCKWGRRTGRKKLISIYLDSKHLIQLTQLKQVLGVMGTSAIFEAMIEEFWDAEVKGKEANFLFKAEETEETEEDTESDF